MPRIVKCYQQLSMQKVFCKLATPKINFSVTWNLLVHSVCECSDMLQQKYFSVSLVPRYFASIGWVSISFRKFLHKLQTNSYYSWLLLSEQITSCKCDLTVWQADMFYLQFGHYLNACFLFLSAEVQGAIKVVVCFRAGLIEEHHSGVLPLFPAISVCLNRVADRCSAERRTCKNDWTNLSYIK